MEIIMNITTNHEIQSLRNDIFIDQNTLDILLNEDLLMEIFKEIVNPKPKEEVPISWDRVSFIDMNQIFKQIAKLKLVCSLKHFSLTLNSFLRN